jgi:capsular polysaccharide biosynthesis protein
MQVRREPEWDITDQVAEGEHAFSLRDLKRVVLNYIWVFVLVMLVSVGLTMGVSLVQTPVYEASAKILVGQPEGSSMPGNLGNDVQGLQQLTQTMVELIKDRPVAEAVIQEQGLSISAEELEQNLEALQIGQTQVIQVSYKDPSAQRAQQVVNSVGEVFSKQIPVVSPSANPVNVTLWEQAEVPGTPVRPKYLMNIAVAVVAGLMLNFVLLLLLVSWGRRKQ